MSRQFKAAGHMGGRNFSDGTLADGTAVVIDMLGAPMPCTVWARPASGDTVTVSYSVDGGQNYEVWQQGTSGAVTAYAADVLLGPVTHVKFQRTAGAGTTSTYGVVG